MDLKVIEQKTFSYYTRKIGVRVADQCDIFIAAANAGAIGFIRPLPGAMVLNISVASLFRCTEIALPV